MPTERSELLAQMAKSGERDRGSGEALNRLQAGEPATLLDS